MRTMRSEVATDGKNGIDHDGTRAADAPPIGAVAVQRPDAARVWGAARDSAEHADVVAAGLPAGGRAREWHTCSEGRGVYRSATTGDGPNEARGSGGRPAQRARTAGTRR